MEYDVATQRKWWHRRRGKLERTMATTLAFDARRAQQEALTAVSNAVDAIEVGKDAYLYTFDERRQRMTEVLTTYQTFKHDRIYDRAIAGSDAGEASKARDLKVACI